MMSKDLENVTSKEVNIIPAISFFLLDCFSRQCCTAEETPYDEVSLASECVSERLCSLALLFLSFPAGELG